MKPWSEGQSNFPPRLTFAILLVLSIPRITTKGVKLATPAETSTDSKVSRNGLKGKDPLSILERSLVSRGFATPEDLNRARLSLSAANSHGSNPGASPSGTAFLSVLVDRGVLTTSQSERLSREIVSDTPKRIEIPGFQMLEKIGRGCMGVVYRRVRRV